MCALDCSTCNLLSCIIWSILSYCWGELQFSKTIKHYNFFHDFIMIQPNAQFSFSSMSIVIYCTSINYVPYVLHVSWEWYFNNISWKEKELVRVPMWLLCDDELVSCPQRDSIQAVSRSTLLHPLWRSLSRILGKRKLTKCGIKLTKSQISRQKRRSLGHKPTRPPSFHLAHVGN